MKVKGEKKYVLDRKPWMKYKRHRDKSINGRGQSLRKPWSSPVPLHFSFPGELRPHARGVCWGSCASFLRRVAHPRHPTALSQQAAKAAGRETGLLGVCMICQRGYRYTCAGETTLLLLWKAGLNEKMSVVHVCKGEERPSSPRRISG